MTTFSIIIPVYNVEKEIRQCLESIQNQTYTDFEALCVDDCGQDNSMAIVKEFADADSRFKILVHEHNKGVSAARNTALDVAQGEYIMFADSDDWMELNALETVKKVFDSENVNIVIFNNYDCYPDKKKELTKRFGEEKGNFSVTIDEDNLSDYVGVSWNRAYKASLIKDNNIRFPVGIIVEDSEFTFKACILGKKVYELQDVLYDYRKEREGSYTTEDKTSERISDEIKIHSRCWDWAVEHGYSRQYRKYFLQVISEVTKKILTIPHKRKFILERIRDLLNRMNFPQDFKDLEKKTLTLWMPKK